MDTRQVGCAVLAGSIISFLVVLDGSKPAASMSSLVDSAQVHQSLTPPLASESASAGSASSVSRYRIAQHTLAQYTLAQYTLAQYSPAAPPNQTLGETGCRQTNSTTGLYAQPSLDSSSRAILNSGQTVRLELTGTGTGWARITAPAVGWVESRYLTPPTACTGLPPASSISSQMAMPAQGGVQAPTAGPTALPAATPTVTAVCEVLPSEGLVVRSAPSISPSTALYTIPKGVHQFQFTSDHLVSHANSVERRWAYITAPYPGWISLGVVGGSFNLGGKTCG